MARKSDDTAGRPGERVAKVMARAGLGSRREAEEWIAAGRVTVNGEVITTPAINVTAQDRVVVDGKPLPARERTRLFLYHKPRGLITARMDPQGRPTVFDVLPKTLPRLLSIGRLDLNTEGLLLLTNDGGLARILELPATGWLRRYRVRAFGRVTQQQLDGLRKGVEVDGIQYGPIEATLEREQASNVWLTFAMREGKNREVRNVLGDLGLQVARLIRVSYGPFQLGELAEGAVEEVPTRILRDQLGERVARMAGVDFAAPVIVRNAAAEPREDEARVQRSREKWPEHPSSDERRPKEQSEGRDDRRPKEGREARPERPRMEGRSAGGRADTREPRRETSRGRTGKDRPGERPASADRDARRTGRGRDERRERDPKATGRDAERPAAKTAKKSDYAWREQGGPPKRKYRGAPRGAPEVDAAPRSKRAGLLKDRKGRRVLVERVGDPKPPAPPPAAKRRGKPPSRDRSSGPRPSRPRSR